MLLTTKKSGAERIRFIAYAGVIAALYTVLTITLAPFSYGEIQIRLAEALCVLPYFTPAAIPGLFIGCLLSNLFSPAGVMWADVVFGSAATLAASALAYMIGRIPFRGAAVLVPLPEVILNALAMPFILKYGYGSEYGLFTVFIFILAGQFISCFGLGLPLLFTLKKLNPVKRTNGGKIER